MSTEKNSRLGTYVSKTAAGETVRAFVPPPLPPDPPVNLTRLYPQLDRANQALGRLDGLTTLLPDTRLFLYLYVRKEALLSSQIEGTKSSFSDLLLFENEAVPSVPIDDVEEVSNYVAAMQHGLRRIKGGFPLSLRLIREIHAILLRGGRGANKTPGEFRRSQNWIGGNRPGNAAFVPPSPELMMECLDRFEHFLHDEKHNLPVLVEAGLIHVQFETIHPFLDGNGRLGRLLITLLLCAKGVLREPLLYLSLYFKTHRQRYYDLLQRVRTEGVWEEWIEFFLEGTESTARQAADTAVQILHLFEVDRKKIRATGRKAASGLAVHEYLQAHPLTKIGPAAKDAYILGYFRYDFFTVAVHYAARALEAAIKARWSASLPQKVDITCGSDQAEMHFPSHTKISGLYRRNKWRGRTVFVDGQRFPLSMDSLLDWLEREKIVTKWERKGLGIGLSMRNELSHVEHSTTEIPSPDKLRFVAGLVNKLFHSLP